MLQERNPKNEDIKVYVKDGLYPRNEAKVSVFDSVVQGGDAVWEGLRVYPEGVVCLDKHLTRLQESAKTEGQRSRTYWLRDAVIAQLAEQLICNQ